LLNNQISVVSTISYVTICPGGPTDCLKTRVKKKNWKVLGRGLVFE